MRPVYRTTSKPLASTNGMRGRINAVREALREAGVKRYLSALVDADPSLAQHQEEIRAWLTPLRNVPDSALEVVERMEAALPAALEKANA